MSNTNNQAKLLIVDDDVRLREKLHAYLTEQQFDVKMAAGGTEMDKLLKRYPFDLIILDLMMPGEDGLSICRRLREQVKELPILFLSAKGDEVDRIVGLELGADDYMPKPFNPRELVARIKSILRRQNIRPKGAPTMQESIVKFGTCEVNLAKRQVLNKGTEVMLTSGEFELLKVFIEHPGQPLTREQLLHLARGREYEVFDRSIDVQISRLRKIIEEKPSRPVYIQTVWSVGYVFVPEGEFS